MHSFPPSAQAVQQRLRELANPEAAKVAQKFFKTGPGQYGEGDVFLGIRMPVLRKEVKAFEGLRLSTCETLLQSAAHEDRMFGLLMMVRLYEKGSESDQAAVYAAYLKHSDRINNWDLVDVTTPQIIGARLVSRSRKILYRLAKSPNLWERRISVLATLYFIRREEYTDTLRLCALLLRDREDLMHKACGWMLREVGKRDLASLLNFLDMHTPVMPRTMLRYAIEKLPETQRRAYLALPREARV